MDGAEIYEFSMVGNAKNDVGPTNGGGGGGGPT